MAGKVLDANLHEVPIWLREPFLGRKEMAAWASRVEDLRAHAVLIGHEPCGALIDQSEIARHLRAAATAMLRAMPYEPCVCRPATVWCGECKNRRWLPDPSVRSSLLESCESGPASSASAGT